MNHLKPYKMYENIETAEMTFKTYIDKMSVEDRIKMDSLLDKDPRKWSLDDKNFMRKMSKKNVTLYIGSDGKTYTKDEIDDMGYDIKSIKKTKHADFEPNVTNLMNKYKEALKLSKELSSKYKEEYDFTKIVNPINDDLDIAIYKLNKLI